MADAKVEPKKKKGLNWRQKRKKRAKRNAAPVVRRGRFSRR